MKILDHEAATLLYEHVKTLEDHPHDIWRCIYLHLASKQAHCNPELREHFVVEHIEEILDNTEGEIFVCDDGDIFILFPGALRPVINKLSNYFKDLKLDGLSSQPANTLFTIFDLSRYWQLFFKLCDAKYKHSIEPGDSAMTPDEPESHPMHDVICDAMNKKKGKTPEPVRPA